MNCSAEALYQTTEALFNLLKELPKGPNREEYLDHLQELLNERQKVIDEISPDANLTSFDKRTQVLKMDQFIQKQMLELQKEIQKDRQLVKRKRQSSARYVNLHRNTSRDGMFIDKKK